MSQPTPYEPSHDFSVDIVPGDEGNALDEEFDDIQLTLDQILVNLLLLQRDDGALANAIVTPFSLSADTVAMIGDWTVRGAWVTATLYSQLDLVTNGGITYLCLVQHVGGTFATDLAAGKWMAYSRVDGITSTFMLTLLDDADAATARTTLGAAPLASPTFTGVPAAPTAAPGTNTTQLATTGFVKAAIDVVLGGVSAAFDTLSEIVTELALKAPIAAPTFTGLVTAAAATFTGLLTTNGQIKFPAVANPSADANTLDDYEEGTWTPAIGGTATYTVNSGSYTKIGRLVTAQCRLQINLRGTGSQHTISGLPFASSNTPGVDAAGAVNYAGLVTNVVNVVAKNLHNTSTIALVSATAAGTALAGNNILTDGSEIYCTITYEI